MTLGGQADEASSRRMVDACLDAGIDFFDTANVYNQGRSEEILGRALGARRPAVKLASKVGAKMGDARDERGLSQAAMRRGLEGSLRRLGTDYLDVYYLHTPDYENPIEETLETMDRFVREGKVRYPATSNYASWQVCRMLWLAEKNGYRPAPISQPMYNLLARGVEQEYLPMAKALGVATVVYNPLAGGLLTGKQQPEAPLAGTRFEGNQMYMDRYWHPAFFDAVERLRTIAEAAGRTMPSLALNWLLRHSPADCVILGASRVEQLVANVAACEEGPLPPETLEACDRVWRDLRGVVPKYNR
ncbi:MAG: aldo/keto reductase [Bryobacteraceae bacterium]|nr:aldo/keto reductase [Bryobacteraceae bacterium]